MKQIEILKKKNQQTFKLCPNVVTKQENVSNNIRKVNN